VKTKICGRGAIADLLASAPGRYDLLLITNPGVGPPAGVPALARRMLHLEFDDCVAPRRKRRLPTAEDVRQALEWAEQSADLVVACHAGVSRSAALAYVIRCRDWSPRRALQILNRGRHRPNALIVRLGAELLDDPRVYDTYAAWISECAPRKRQRR
jgi:predicted protein tyrosine phosphatase